ncbi:unnamed protein product, partial [Allacma fusca]
MIIEHAHGSPECLAELGRELDVVWAT